MMMKMKTALRGRSAEPARSSAGCCVQGCRGGAETVLAASQTTVMTACAPHALHWTTSRERRLARLRGGSDGLAMLRIWAEGAALECGTFEAGSRTSSTFSPLSV
jgi:hypothetical protein